MTYWSKSTREQRFINGTEPTRGLVSRLESRRGTQECVRHVCAEGHDMSCLLGRRL